MKQKVFRIAADYRPTTKNYYYIIADNKQQAKMIFNWFVSWLKVIDIQECDADTAKAVLDSENWNKYILFDENGSVDQRGTNFGYENRRR